MRRWLVLAALLSVAVSAMVGLSAAPAIAATPITTIPIATQFNNPIGVDYYEPDIALNRKPARETPEALGE